MNCSVKNWWLVNKTVTVLLFFFVSMSHSSAQSYINRVYSLAADTSFGIDGFTSGILIAPDSNIIVQGFETKSDNSSPLHLCKINSNTGDTLWIKRYGNNVEKHYKGFHNTLLISGNFIYCCGPYSDTSGNYSGFLYKFNLQGDTIWRKLYTDSVSPYKIFNSLKLTRNGDLIIGGIKQSPSGFTDLYLTKIDTNGITLWEKNYGGSSYEGSYNVDTTTDGGFILAGITDSYGAGSYDAYIVKTDSFGNFQWQKWYGGPYSDWGFVKSQSDGTYLLYGGMHNTSSSYNAFIYKLNTLGNIVWQANPLFPADNTGLLNEIEGISVDIFGNIMAVGNYNSTLNANNPISFLYKFNQSGDSLLFKNYNVRPNDNYLWCITPFWDGGFIMAGFVFPDGSGTTQDSWLVRVDSMGCESISCVLSVDDIEQTNNTSMLVYPNPASQSITVQINIENNIGNVMLYDIYGRLILTSSLNNNQTIIDVSNLPSGIYQVVYSNKNELLSKKLVVSK